MIPEGGITRYVGDALALAVVNHRESLVEVLDLIELDAEELQPVTDPERHLRKMRRKYTRRAICWQRNSVSGETRIRL